MMSSTGRIAGVAVAATILSVTPLLALTTSWLWLVPSAIAVGLIIGLGHALRRIRIPAPVVTIVQPLALVYWLGVLVASDVAWYGFVPNSEWADRLLTLFEQGVEATAEEASPIPVDEFNGVLLLLVGGAGIVAWMVDILLVTFRAPVLTGAPFAACYVVTAVITNGQVEWWWFVPPAVGYLALLVTDRRAHVIAWGRSATTSSRRGGVPQADSLVRTGRRVGAMALAAAVAVPALVPILTEGLIPADGIGGGGGDGRIIRTDNPILDIRDNLQQPDDVVVLSYETNAVRPTYLRLAVTDEFDGEQWKPSAREVPDSQSVDNGLPEPPGLDRDRVEDVEDVEYEINVQPSLSLDWLPLPYPATSIDIGGDWRYDTATLDVVSGSDDGRSDFGYSVGALEITPTYDELVRAGDHPDDLDRLTELPDDFSQEVIALAQSITEGAKTDIERAQRLQAFFRNTNTAEGGFIYDPETDLGGSANAMEEFLRIRRGFCVQFATTMAAMARALDIPARVATGWVRGERDSNQWVVRANDAHAWPELYFEGVGWVMFEPTPSARDGATRPIWSIPPADDSGENNGPTANPSSTALPGGGRPELLEERQPIAPGGGGFDAQSQWPSVVLVVVAVAALLSLPRGVAWARHAMRWRRAGDDPAHRAEAAWADLRDAVRDARLTWHDADTPRMIGNRIATDSQIGGEDRDLLAHVVTTTERARYSRRVPDEPELREDSAMLRRDILRSQPLRTRVAAYLWPSAIRDFGGSLSSGAGRLLDWFDGVRSVVRMRVFRQPQ